ncbi:hypothetical protein NKH56_33120, partial [Mesorhizobium sp. M1076]|uniref:hypothetical protein n=1 Tax=Mesorhizobium sp. M1076 TaxID=2957054 RepID=UPI00333AEEEA
HRAMAARPSEQAPFSLQNFLQNLQHTILAGHGVKRADGGIRHLRRDNEAASVASIKMRMLAGWNAGRA